MSDNGSSNGSANDDNQNPDDWTTSEFFKGTVDSGEGDHKIHIHSNHHELTQQMKDVVIHTHKNRKEFGDRDEKTLFGHCYVQCDPEGHGTIHTLSYYVEKLFRGDAWHYRYL